MSSEARGGAAAAPLVLEDVVACIMGQSNAKPAITARIQRHGGRAASRLGKEVSHIVWERRHSRRPSDKAADEAELLELFHKLEKMDYPPVVVSPLWVEESIKAGRRLVERKFLVKKPTESLLGRTPGTGGGAAKKRKRPVAMPKPAEAYELDELPFSSTQQMAGAGDGGGYAGTADGPGAGGPRGGKQPRRGGGGRGAQQERRGGGRAAAAASLATVVELLDGEEGGEGGGGDHRRPEPGIPNNVGSATQAVANILTIDLPDDDDREPSGTPGGFGSGAGDADMDELDTPLAMRFARSSADRAAARGGGAQKEWDVAAAACPAMDKRSRLATGSGPVAAAAAATEEQVLADAACELAGDGSGMEVDALPEDHQPAANPSEGRHVEETPPSERAQEAALQERPANAATPAVIPAAGQQAASGAATAAAARGVAARFSVRQLERHPERPVVLHKGTPLLGVLPPPSAGSRPPAPIPVPVVERVTSPWAQADQLPTQTPASQAAGTAAKPAPTASRTSQGRPGPAGRVSLLGVSNVRRHSAVGGAAQPPVEGQSKVPTPWSALRPWDGRPAPDAERQPGGDENRPGPQQQQQQQGDGCGAAQRPPVSGRRKNRSSHAEQAPDAAAGASGGPAPGPTTGCIALTSVDGGVMELARSAARRLRGLRVCPEGREEGQVTHLVVGEERRTLKLMLAVANGAWLLSPHWVTASLEAGRWLPESQFPAKVRFEAAAERARSRLDDPDALPLLHDALLYVHLPDKARKLMTANAAALKRVAVALGAKVVTPKACNLCVVVGGAARPLHIPEQACCVREEWLLLAAERFELLSKDEFLLE